MRKIAHRPRQQSMHYTQTAFLNVRTPFFAPRWMYRQQRPATFEKHPLGYRLSLIPLRYRLAHQIVVYQAATG